MNTTERIEVNRARLMSRHASLARIGATGRGGVNRQALTTADIEGRARLIEWARSRNFSCSADHIGNLFIRRAGKCDNFEPVLTGSHLDTQPTGGNFDGVFGVLATLELLETLEDNGLETLRPIELVVWTNEEGSRFQPATMGSAVFAGALALEEALAIVDRDGVSVAAALDSMWQRLSDVSRKRHSHNPTAYVEAHIEQGPVLESKGCSIGIVTGIQGMRQFAIEVVGETGHAGTTPMLLRRDAFMEAMTLALELQAIALDPDDFVRFTIGRFDVMPGSPNTIPNRVLFTVDLRHPDERVLESLGDKIVALCRRRSGRCPVTVRELLNSHPVQFDRRICAAMQDSALRRGYSSVEMLSGATHDANSMSALCPTGMIFVPCKNGVSHSESEMASEEDMVAGANVLFDVVTWLANGANAVQAAGVDDAGVVTTPG